MAPRSKAMLARDRAVLTHLREVGPSTHAAIASRLKASKRNVLLSLGRLVEIGLVLASKADGATRWEATASRAELDQLEPEPASEAPVPAADAPVPAGTTALYRRRLTPARDEDDDMLDLEAGRSAFMPRSARP